jgi:hypothetical protein
MKVVIHASYGSTKDVAVYAGLGVEPNAIFVIGGKSKRNEKLATVRYFNITFCINGFYVIKTKLLIRVTTL